ncbi:hypothetical protein NP590_14725 [Methylomonas sp. SURF-2]|uniref:Uncharacterized protein n=1 Tax=Methylomonas subterranea TaxID=2952225 RepID=A0ABT1TIR0_9GAMM|nr:hypothetical protein [Methylomonas sp. SURF-2]MCQ8105367.1 hypothetical protein [Methylomonas sp. SURF-2]
MAEDLVALRAVLSSMEAALSSISELNAEVLEFVDVHYPDMLNDQKVVQVFKNVGDAEDELQRQLNFLRMRLTAGIPDFKALCDTAGAAA